MQDFEYLVIKSLRDLQKGSTFILALVSLPKTWSDFENYC